MALKQETIAMHRTDDNGNKVLQMPITTSENVEGIEFLPVGTILPFSGGTVPTGYLTCNGAAVSRTTYADLFAVIGTTYGKGNGSTTFNLPNLNNNSFLEGSDTVGTVKNAGLPDITGTMPNMAGGAWYDGIGAFVDTQATGELSVSGSGHYGRRIDFKASNSNSIYGNSNTVQPKSVTVKYIIKAFAGVSNGGSVDARNIMDALQINQADIGNINNKISGISDYIVQSYSSGTQWYEVYRSGKVRQGGIVTLSNTKATVTFLKPMANANYTALVCLISNNDAGGDAYNSWVANGRTTTQMVIKSYNDVAPACNMPRAWVVEGQGA